MRNAFGFDPAAVHLRDVLHDGEAQPGASQFAAARLVGAVETLKDAGQIRFRNADTVIAHADRDFFAMALRLQTNFAADCQYFKALSSRL